MNINPMKAMALKAEFSKFQNRHPKVLPFFNAVYSNALRENTVIEMHVSTEDGKQYSSNIKVTAEDIRLLQELRETMQG